jgi:hypothetical protein
LEVLAKISSREEYFTNMMRSLIQLYSVDPALLERRSSLITRHLSLFLSPEKIFRAMANILETVEDLEFASVMIQTLNIILLTSSELHEMRCNLKDLMNDTSRDLFTVLYRYVSMCQCTNWCWYCTAWNLIVSVASLLVVHGATTQLQRSVSVYWRKPMNTRQLWFVNCMATE